MIGYHLALFIFIDGLFKLTNDKREEISAQWLCRAELHQLTISFDALVRQWRVCYCLPFCRQFKAQPILCFQIGLVETWEQRTGSVGNKKRVHKLLIAIKRLIACLKIYHYGVLSRNGPLTADNNMLIHSEILRRLSIDLDRMYLLCRLTEIDDHLICFVQSKGNSYPTVYSLTK